MTALNHGLVGGLIGSVLPWPLAIPLAIASHFILDMLPHYSVPPHTRHIATVWKCILALDVFLSVSMIIWAIHGHHYAICACGLLAFSPDFLWILRAIKTKSFDFSSTKNRFEQWHIRIQRRETPYGLWIEAPLAALLFYMLVMKAV